MIQVLGFILIGLIIGALARLLKPGKQKLSLVMTLVLGCVGALIGGIVASLIGTGSLSELDFIGFVVALIAAVLLIGVAEGASGARKS